MPNSLRVRAAATELVALTAVVVLGVLARRVLPLSVAFPVKAGIWFAAIAAIVVGGISGKYHPFAVFGRANHVTTARAAFVALVAAAIAEPAEPIVAASAAA